MCLLTGIPDQSMWITVPCSGSFVKSSRPLYKIVINLLEDYDRRIKWVTMQQLISHTFYQKSSILHKIYK